MEEVHSRLEDLAEADFAVGQATCQESTEDAAQQQQLHQQWQPQQHWQQQQLQHQPQQQVQHSSGGGCSSAGHSSGGGCSTGTVHMGDDFECMASEDVSMLLEDTAEYPGGCCQQRKTTAYMHQAYLNKLFATGRKMTPAPAHSTSKCWSNCSSCACRATSSSFAWVPCLLLLSS
jgi:hypothetical protein